MMALATAAAWCVSYSPNRLGVAAQFLDSSLVFEAGDVARSCFVSRHAAFEASRDETKRLDEKDAVRCHPMRCADIKTYTLLFSRHVSPSMKGARQHWMDKPHFGVAIGTNHPLLATCTNN